MKQDKIRQDADPKREPLIKNEPIKEVLGELSKNLMNSLIERKTKFSKLKKFKINDFNKLSNPK